MERAREIDGVEPWTVGEIATRDGAPHQVLSRRWIEGRSLRALRDEDAPGDAVIVGHLAAWLAIVERVEALGLRGVWPSARAENILVTARGVVAVDLAIGGGRRILGDSRAELADTVESLLGREDAPKLGRFLEKLREGGYGTPSAVESALRHATGVPRPPKPKRAQAREPPAPEPVTAGSPREVAKPRGRALRAGERIIEMTWRCSSCRHRNLGRHKACVECGSPKDGSEVFEMPEDTSKAVSVTRDDLLAMALDGPDWRCAYCGSDQRRADRACGRCGASALDAEEATEPKPRPVARRPVTPWHGRGWGRALLAVLAVAVLALAVRAWRRRPRDLQAVVTAATWRQSVVVERWAIRTREGFAERRVGAVFDVTAMGSRVHHYERVLDGYDTESYTENVACGEDCTESSQTCREQCSSNSNGFATCRTVCSGGGRSCTTRYCAEPRTRQVPRYRSEARYAEWYRWRVWDWATQRTLSRHGTVAPMPWPPDEEVALSVGLGPGEQERARREGRYEVSIRDSDETRWTFTAPTPEDYLRFAVGTTHALHTEAGRATLDGRSWQGLE